MATQLDVSLKEYPSAQDYNGFYNKMAGIVVNITANYYSKKGPRMTAIGGGVVIHENGVILSCKHIFEGDEERGWDVTVCFHDKTEYPATIIHMDESKDLSLLWIDTKGRKLAYGLIHNQCVRGQPVIVIGSPRQHFQICFGKISDPLFPYGDMNDTNYSDTFQVIELHGANCARGVSGSPLFDHKGRILGVVLIGYCGMDYCASANEINNFIQESCEKPEVNSYFSYKTPSKPVSGTSRKRKPSKSPKPPKNRSKALRNIPELLSMKQGVAYITVSESAWWQDLHWEMSDSIWWKEIDQAMSYDATQISVSDSFAGGPKGHFDVDAFCSAGGFVKSMNRHPELKWAEREDKVYLTVLLADAKDANVNLEHEGVFTFSATAGGESNLHEIKLDLLDKVNVEESKISIGTRNIVCVIAKAEKKWWKKLLRGSGKTPYYIKGDWDKWVDEDDNGAPEMDMGGMDFSKLASMGGMDGMNFSKLGGMDVEGMGDDNDYDYDQDEVSKPEEQEGT